MAMPHGMPASCVSSDSGLLLAFSESSFCQSFSSPIKITCINIHSLIREELKSPFSSFLALLLSKFGKKKSIAGTQRVISSKGDNDFSGSKPLSALLVFKRRQNNGVSEKYKLSVKLRVSKYCSHFSVYFRCARKCVADLKQSYKKA